MLLGDYLLAKLWRELFYLSTRNTAAEKREMGVLEENIYIHFIMTSFQTLSSVLFLLY